MDTKVKLREKLAESMNGVLEICLRLDLDNAYFNLVSSYSFVALAIDRSDIKEV